MITLACGVCVDESVAPTIPFAFYWGVLVMLWAVVSAALGFGPQPWSKQMRPWLYILALLPIGFVAAAGTGLALPMLVVAPLWAFRLRRLLAKGAEEVPASGPLPRYALFYLSVQRAFYIGFWLLIPVGYVRVAAQSLLA